MGSVAAHIEFDISALHHNARKVQAYAPQSKRMGVIKANAYGHGLIRVASQLNQELDAFAVARIDEAICLRQAQVKGRILVLQGFSQAEDVAVLQRYQLDVVIHSTEQVALLESLKQQGTLTVWLKIDTEMNRLGILPSQFTALLSRLQHCKMVHSEIRFMTHFSSADDLQDGKTLQQLQLFNETVKHQMGEKSSANSAGLIAWPASRQDWVRPGIMLYGVSPLLEKTADQLGLLPVMNLYSRLIAIKQVKKGQAVGYGGSWVANKETRIGVVSIGYGDGYPRHAKPGTPVLIGDKLVPLIGRVSMDMLTVDLSTYKDVKMDAKVLLWGAGLPVEQIATFADTVPYTLLCGITQRVSVHAL